MWNNENNGYTRGGRDVTESINLLFKGLLISPILILAVAVSIGMLKNLLFMGIPTINTPSNEQIEQIRQRDRQITPRNLYSAEPKAPTAPVPTTVKPPVAGIWQTSKGDTVLATVTKYSRVQCESDLATLHIEDPSVIEALKNTCNGIR